MVDVGQQLPSIFTGGFFSGDVGLEQATTEYGTTATIAAESGAATTTESSIGGNPASFSSSRYSGSAAGDRRRRERWQLDASDSNPRDRKEERHWSLSSTAKRGQWLWRFLPPCFFNGVP
nr:hypothetical protein Iba_chr12fCG20730 [Ipomoea batatas]GME02398.1 hypothetical protein Iba_contig4788CG0010 [Ipomoea batatas]